MINNLAPVFDTEIIRQAHRDYEATGRLLNIIFAKPQEEKAIGEGKVAYVDMNQSGIAEMTPGQEGILATDALGGCTGVSGFARMPDGALNLMVSHYNETSQNFNNTGCSSPANLDMYGFMRTNVPVLFVVAYHDSVFSPLQRDERKRNNPFEKWHYLDQIRTTATQLGENSKVIEIPYEPNKTGHSLAAGRINGVEGIFWDGHRVDFS